MQDDEGYLHSVKKLTGLFFHIGKVWVEGALNLVYRLFGRKQ